MNGAKAGGEGRRTWVAPGAMKPRDARVGRAVVLALLGGVSMAAVGACGSSGSGDDAAGGAGAVAGSGGAGPSSSAGAAGASGLGGVSGLGGTGGASGSAGAAGGGGGGTAGGGSGGAGAGCERQAPAPWTFVGEKVRDVAAGALASGIASLGDGPRIVFFDDDESGAKQVWGAPRATVEGGSTVNVATRLSRAQATGSLAIAPPSVRVTAGGVIRVVYPERFAGVTSLRHVEWSGAADDEPADTLVELTPIHPVSPALALDSEGRSVAAVIATNDRARVSSQSGNGWQTSEVTSGGIPPSARLALAIDAAGAVLLFTAGGAGLPGVNANTNASGSWVRQPLDAPESASWVWAGADATAQVNVFFASTEGLHHAAAPAWSVTQLIDAATGLPLPRADAFDVAVAPDGEIHLVLAPPSGGIRYARFDTCVWRTQPVEPGFGTRSSPVITLGADGTPHIAYVDVDLGELWYAHGE
jgi:hypothetical protein